MELGFRKYKEIFIIDVKGDMDLYNAQELKEAVNKILAKRVSKIVINLEEVDYIDSSGIGALIHVFGETKKAGIRLKFSHVHGSVAKVIKLTKLMNYFPITDDLKTALHQLS